MFTVAIFLPMFTKKRNKRQKLEINGDLEMTTGSYNSSFKHSNGYHKNNAYIEDDVDSTPTAEQEKQMKAIIATIQHMGEHVSVLMTLYSKSHNIFYSTLS